MAEKKETKKTDKEKTSSKKETKKSKNSEKTEKITKKENIQHEKETINETKTRRLNMFCVRNVTEDLYWVGGNDHRLALFENIHPLTKGVSYN